VIFLPVWSSVNKKHSQYEQLIWTLSTVLRLLIHSICKTGHNMIINKKVRIMDRFDIIIVEHNCQTQT